MAILAFILTFIVMIEHIYIMILEMFFANTKLAAKTFGVEKELLANKKVQTLFANQGLYNGFLAAGLVWGLFFAGAGFAETVQIFFLSCVVVAALFGGATSSKGILVKQGLPAVLRWLRFCWFRCCRKRLGLNLSLFIMEIELAFQTNNLLIFPIFIKNRLVNAFHPC